MVIGDFMKIEINGKEFIFNGDPRWGILELMQSQPENPKVIKAFIKEILVPSPTDKEFFNFRKSDIFRIIEEYSDLEEKELTEFKKKRSRS